MKIIDNTLPLLLSQWKGYCRVEIIENFINNFSSHPDFKGQLCLLALPPPILKVFSSRDIIPEVILGAKSMDSVEKDAFTASIALDMLLKAGAKFVLIGSAESRFLLKESDASINKKIHCLINSEIVPVLCFGESFEQHQNQQTVEILTIQLREALKGLDESQQAKIVLFYEAPWLRKSQKIHSLDDCQTILDQCQQAIHEVLSEAVQAKIRFVYAFPDDIGDLTKFTNQIQVTGGYYCEKPEILLDLLPLLKPLDGLSQPTNEGIKESSYIKMPQEITETPNYLPALLPEEVPDHRTPVLSEHVAMQSEATSNSSIENVIISQKETATPLEKPVTASSNELLQPSEQTEQMALPRPEQDKQEDHSFPEQDKQESIEASEPARQETLQPQEPAKQEPVEIFQQSKQEAPPPTEQAEKELESSEHVQPLSEPVTLPSSELVNQITNEEIVTIEARMIALNDSANSLESLYTTLQGKVNRLNELRIQYPITLESVSQHISSLDPELQRYISQGDMDFFHQHPEILEKVRPSLGLIQQMNEIIMEAAAIPREVDRIKSYSNKLRTKLMQDWEYLLAQRHEIRMSHPDLTFPQIPKVLSSPTPQIDLSLPAFTGPSPLLNKRIGIVKRDKKA